MNNIEHRTQVVCVNWFRRQHRKYADVFFAIPNGGQRSPVTGAILKAEGAMAGVADLFLSVARHGFHGLYIELKSDKGKQSESQERFQNAVEKHNYKYIVIRSFNEFERYINYYLS